MSDIFNLCAFVGGIMLFTAAWEYDRFGALVFILLYVAVIVWLNENCV